MIFYFLIFIIAQNQSFVQKEVGENTYSSKRASISLFIALSRIYPHILINVTLLLFYLNCLKRILMRHKFNLNYNLYINFNFTNFFITIYIIIYKIFFENLSNPYISIFS